MTTPHLSSYRQQLRELLREIEQLAFKCAHADGLIKGTPNEVWRTCGKSTCPCMGDPTKRHGPYRVVQVFKQGKQKQIALRKDQEAIWKKVKNYQAQKNAHQALKKKMQALDQLVKKIMMQRFEEFPHDSKSTK